MQVLVDETQEQHTAAAHDLARAQLAVDDAVAVQVEKTKAFNDLAVRLAAFQAAIDAMPDDPPAVLTLVPPAARESPVARRRRARRAEECDLANRLEAQRHIRDFGAVSAQGVSEARDITRGGSTYSTVTELAQQAGLQAFAVKGPRGVSVTVWACDEGAAWRYVQMNLSNQGGNAHAS